MDDGMIGPMAGRPHESEMRAFTREELEGFSKAQLIDIILAHQEEIEMLQAQVAGLQSQVEELQRRLNMNSQNSSKPPSSDGPETKDSARKAKKKGGTRKRGGQPGHEGHRRDLLPVDEVDDLTELKPCACKSCGRQLDEDEALPHPHRHQVWELPPIQPEIKEFQLFTTRCPDCGEFTCAELPDGVPSGAFGPRLQATVALLTGVYRLSKRSVEGILEDSFNVPISLGSITTCEANVSQALAGPVDEAWEAAQSAETMYADETSWREGNEKAWLWVAVTSVATVFMIHARRNQQAARALLGAFAGVLVSDRHGAYGFYKRLRQWCWAHLRRDFTAFSEYPGRAGEIGAALLDHCDQMFHWWHRVRDGTLKRSTFQQYMWELRAEVEALLREGAQCGHAAMENKCAGILKHVHYLWTFVRWEGVEPTNNAAERAVRPAVLWRKGSYGTQSAEGSRFVERVMTAAATCKQHKRNITDYLAQACEARLHNRPAPSLLPQSTKTHQQAA